MSDIIHELDVVALTADVPEHGLVRGQVGAVVMELSPDHAEVEFVDPQGRTYALVALAKGLLLRLRYQPVMAA